MLQPLRWCCVDCMIHHERDVRQEKKYTYVARTSNNRVIPMELSWWVTSNNACEPVEQLIVPANGNDESDLVGWSLLLLAATVGSFAHMPLGISDRNNGYIQTAWRLVAFSALSSSLCKAFCNARANRRGGTSSRCLPCRFITAALSDQPLNGHSAAYSIC